MAKIEIKGATKEFGRQTVLRRLDLVVGEGEFFCLVGPSGCGKTTLLNLVAGLEELSSGQIHFDGRRVDELGPRERDVAMVFQNYALYPHKTVGENLAFPLVVRRLPRAEISLKVAEVAGRMGLSALLERRPSQLSGGQQQRVALGRALIRQPRAFLMDEPLSNLDAKLRTQMRLELKKLHQDFPVTTLYVTHDQEEAMSLSDRMAILRGGDLQQVGTPLEVYERPANLFVAQFVGKPSMNVLEASIGPDGVVVGEARLSLPEARLEALARAAGERILLGVRPEAVALGAPSTPSGNGEVAVVEPMGSETWVETVWQGRKLLAKAPGRTALKPKDSVSVSLRAEDLHFFDAASEKRLAV